jgi:VanZ family protein
LSPRIAWIVAVVYALILTNLVLAPHPLWLFGGLGDDTEQAVDRTISGYVQHGLAYALLAWLLVWASRTHGLRGRLGCAAFAAGHGIVAEWLQHFVPLRYADWRDGLANTLGAALGWLLAVLILRRASTPSTEAAGATQGNETPGAPTSGSPVGDGMTAIVMLPSTTAKGSPALAPATQTSSGENTTVRSSLTRSRHRFAG